MSGRYAVVIGINYRNFPATMDQEAQSHAGINALNYAEADADEMAKLLEADGYDVVKLVDLDATRTGIISALREQNRKAGPEGLLLVHYSGHGALDPNNRELAYLLPVNADPGNMDATAILLESIARDHLGHTQSALVILDCCHSGYAVGFKSTGKDVVLNSEAAAVFSQQAGQTFKRVLGRVIIAACAGQQLTREREDLKHGVLTYYVLKHWRESGETVDDFSLYRYLAGQMRAQGVPPPVRGATPQQGVIELRPARTNIDRTSPYQISEPEANVSSLSPTKRATLFRLISGVVGNPMHLRHLYYLVDLKFRANSRNTDLDTMIRSFIKQAEAAKRISELHEAIDQFRADQQVNNATPSGAEDVGNTSGIQGNIPDVSPSEPYTTSEVNTHLQRGKDYYENHLFEQALNEYNRTIELDPKLAVAYNGRGNVYRSQGDYERALAEFGKAIELDPKLAVAYNGRGNVYYVQKDYKQALVDYNRAIELNPKLAAAYNGRGSVYDIQKDYSQALVDYNRAIELNPKLAIAYYNRGSVYDIQNEYSQALVDYNRAIELNPKLAEAYNGRGNVYFSLEDFEQALVDYNRAIRLNPSLAVAYHGRGSVYRRQGDYNRALTDFVEAIALDPEFWEAHTARGEVYAKLRQP
jgi:tetratricopeptide (TPR) repeat protein